MLYKVLAATVVSEVLQGKRVVHPTCSAKVLALFSSWCL
jgi:hypothetical protein